MNCTVQIAEMESLWPLPQVQARLARSWFLLCVPRANFGKLLRRVDDESGSLVIEKRGIPRAVLLSIRDYVKLAAPEPEVLRLLGKESERNGTSALNSHEMTKLLGRPAPRSQSANAPSPSGDRYKCSGFCCNKARWAPTYCFPDCHF